MLERNPDVVKKQFPRKSQEDRVRLLKVIYHEYMESNLSLNKILDSYGVAKKLFYEWTDKYGLRPRYEALKWAKQAQGKTIEDLDKEELELLRSDKDNSTLRQMGEIFYYIEQGDTAKEAARKAGMPQTTFYNLVQRPAFKAQYKQAKALRIEHLRYFREEEELENIAIADEGRKQLLKNRQKKTVVKKKGVEMVGGRPLDVETTTVKVEELEPDKKMIELTYSLAGFTKDNGPKVDVHVEVLGKFDEMETAQVQSEASKRLEALRNRRLEMGIDEQEYQEVNE